VDEASKQSGSGYRHYVLFMVVIGYALNLFDRQIIGILLPAIKVEFALSDTALGLLSGFAFALFYATLGIPIAKLADRRSRKWIMSASIAVWSAMTFVGGLAQSAAQLIVSRFGVGVGEAGFTPAAVSMLADYFEARKRILAMAIMNLGPVVGIMLGLVIGGWAAAEFGWRGALMLAGAPGLLFAFIFALTVREPKRGAFDLAATSVVESGSPTPFWRNSAYIFLVIGASMSNLGIFAVATWMPSLLDRSYGMGPAEAGMVLGPMFGVAGAIGTFGGGWLSQKLALRDPRWALWLPALCALVIAPLVAAALASHSLTLLLALYGVAYCLSFAYLGPIFATIQTLIGAPDRASAVAWMMFFVNLIGLGLGPQLVGFVSDSLTGAGYTEPLRWALVSVTPLMLVPAIAYWLAARRVHRAQA
jgi:predicted MFS family arabinose efflux permease